MGLTGGYKNGELVCVIGTGPTSETNIKVLKELGYEVELVSTEDLDEMRGLRADLIAIDELNLNPVIPEPKRRGKRKNPNPYQQTMKRGK